MFTIDYNSTIIIVIIIKHNSAIMIVIIIKYNFKYNSTIIIMLIIKYNSTIIIVIIIKYNSTIIIVIIIKYSFTIIIVIIIKYKIVIIVNLLYNKTADTKRVASSRKWKNTKGKEQKYKSFLSYIAYNLESDMVLHILCHIKGQLINPRSLSSNLDQARCTR